MRVHPSCRIQVYDHTHIHTNMHAPTHTPTRTYTHLHRPTIRKLTH